MSLQFYLTLWYSMDCSPPGSSVHGILQARILESVDRKYLQGIFLTQGSSLGLLCPLHGQAGFSTKLVPPEKPRKAASSDHHASLVAQLVKNLPAMQETWVGKIPWRREWLPTPVVLPGEFHRKRSLVSYSPWYCKSWTWLRE